MQRQLTLDMARVYLASRARVRTPLGAGDYLDCSHHYARDIYDKRILIALACLSIYRQLFPDQYARSAAPPFSTQREQEFYRLVHTHCFPLLVDDGEDVLTWIAREPRFFLPFIPIRGLQRYDWFMDGSHVKDFEIPYQLALLLSGALPDDVHTIAGLCFPADFPEPAPPVAAVGWSLFLHACKVHEDSPLRFLPLAFHMVSHKTGNLWLDLPRHVGQAAYAWSPEEVARLTLMRVNADKFDIAVRALHNWFIEDLRARISRVIEIWNDAARKESEAGYGGMTAEDMVAVVAALPR